MLLNTHEMTNILKWKNFQFQYKTAFRIIYKLYISMIKWIYKIYKHDYMHKIHILKDALVFLLSKTNRRKADL